MLHSAGTVETAPIVIFLDGVTGSGKTSAAQLLAGKFASLNLSVHVQDGFKWVRHWAEKNRGNESVVEWKNNSLGVPDFFIAITAYVELSRYVARMAAQEIDAILGAQDGPRFNIIIHEAARGAGLGSHEKGGKKDRYDDDLYDIFIQYLCNRVVFAQLEILLASPDERLRRMQQSGRAGAPPELIRRFYDDEGMPQSAYQQAAPYNMLLNMELSNEGDLEALSQKLDIFVKAIQQHFLPSYN